MDYPYCAFAAATFTPHPGTQANRISTDEPETTQLFNHLTLRKPKPEPKLNRPASLSTVRLPVDGVLPQIVGAFERSPNVVLEAPPGAGKTTRVPPCLLSLHPSREVWVLEPRRLAARLAARRVAEELREPLGQTVGYQVRFEDVASQQTRLRFLTEGVLTRRLLADHHLDHVAAVILDEFHERHLEGDLALALLRRLQLTRRPDLKLLVMSATLDGDAVARHLDHCPVIRSEGRLFETDLRYTPASALPLEDLVEQALAKLLREGLTGDLLVFLPGAREIRRAIDRSAGLLASHGLLALPLYGDLSPDEQDRAVRPASQPKVIFSTNVAESSVTIDGVRVVIDSGLARIAEDSPWTGLPQLTIKRISQASARQRAGRAARQAPGIVVRLYSQEDFARRPAHDTPEILRRELSQLLLDIRALGVNDARALPWLDAPPAEALAAATTLLDQLGATGDTGRRMTALPLHPRLARMVLEADRRGARREAIRLTASLSGGDERVAKQIDRLLGRPRVEAPDDHGYEKSVLVAFPDRVAKHRRDLEVLLARGGSAIVERGPLPPWLIAVDIEERRERGLPLVREWVAIEPDWLLEFFPDQVEDREDLVWNRDSQRVEAVSSLRFGQLVLDETRGRPHDLAAAARLLIERAQHELHRFVDVEEFEALLHRLAFAAQHGAPVFGRDEALAMLAELAEGCVSFNELAAAAAGWLDAIRLRFPDLERIAPERIALPSGRKAKVEYVPGQPPFVASRLQDFFGLRETPRIARGTVPLTVHLLAPSQRPVQVTQDLAGFWTRHYPDLRRELSRRYPKHKWPDDPLAS